MIRPLLTALTFLTVLPLPLDRPPTPEEIGRSTPFYPLVGGILGLILLGVALPLRPLGSEIAAVLTLIVWVRLTGGLHLDGLADVADARAASPVHREKALAVMKDVHNGPAALVAVVLTLLLKFVLIREVMLRELWWSLPAAPLLARSGIVALFLTLPYLRPEGLGAGQSSQLPKGWGWLSVALAMAFLPLAGGAAGALALAGTAMFFL
ncbi:MAG: adenosylcobinamide-GDP ribazoletransferase, partial [Magnetococcales bacterium]|nr:adenosylcobinamide-GDP ribazoletransferase [Magnetococcales bacterium]